MKLQTDSGQKRAAERNLFAASGFHLIGAGPCEKPGGFVTNIEEKADVILAARTSLCL